MAETSFTNDVLTSRGVVCDLRRRKRCKFPKNVITGHVEGIVNQTQESSNQLGDDEDAVIAEIDLSKLGQTENFGKVEEGIKTENKSLDAQECTGNTGQLITEVTATDNNDQDVKAEKECPVNLKVERSEIESKSGCFLQRTYPQQDDGIERQEYVQEGETKPRMEMDVEETTLDDSVITEPIERCVLSKEPDCDIPRCTYIQKANKAITVILVCLAILALVMDCGRSYLTSGKQMMRSSTTDPMNEIPESTKGGPQSHMDQWRNKPLQHGNTKKSTSQLLNNVKDIPEDKRERRRDVYYYTEVKARDPSCLHRGQHITMRRKILGYEMYSHHAIVLNATVLSDQKVEITLIGYSKDKQMNYSEVHRKMPVLITTEVYDLASDDLRIIQYWYPVFSPNEIAQRAESEKEKSKDYNFFFNNCEHFATLAAYGISKSIQIERFFLKNIWRLLMCLVIFLVS